MSHPRDWDCHDCGKVHTGTGHPPDWTSRINDAKEPSRIEGKPALYRQCFECYTGKAAPTRPRRTVQQKRERVGQKKLGL